MLIGSLAVMATPFQFRTKRQLWPYIGLAVVTRSSTDQEFVERSGWGSHLRSLFSLHNVFSGSNLQSRWR